MLNGFLMPIRANGFRLVKKMLDVYNDESPYLIYSMWGGIEYQYHI